MPRFHNHGRKKVAFGEFARDKRVAFTEAEEIACDAEEAAFEGNRAAEKTHQMNAAIESDMVAPVVRTMISLGLTTEAVFRAQLVKEYQDR